MRTIFLSFLLSCILACNSDKPQSNIEENIITPTTPTNTPKYSFQEDYNKLRYGIMQGDIEAIASFINFPFSSPVMPNEIWVAIGKKEKKNEFFTEKDFKENFNNLFPQPLRNSMQKAEFELFYELNNIEIHNNDLPNTQARTSISLDEAAQQVIIDYVEEILDQKTQKLRKDKSFALVFSIENNSLKLMKVSTDM